MCIFFIWILVPHRDPSLYLSSKQHPDGSSYTRKRGLRTFREGGVQQVGQIKVNCLLIRYLQPVARLLGWAYSASPAVTHLSPALGYTPSFIPGLLGLRSQTREFNGVNTPVSAPRWFRNVCSSPIRKYTKNQPPPQPTATTPPARVVGFGNFQSRPPSLHGWI